MYFSLFMCAFYFSDMLSCAFYFLGTFHMLFTFQVCFSFFKCISCAFHFQVCFHVFFTFHVCFLLFRYAFMCFLLFICFSLFRCAFHVLFTFQVCFLLFRCFSLSRCVFHVLFTFLVLFMCFAPHVSQITGAYRCTIYTYMQHQTHMCVGVPYTHTCTTCTHTCITKHHQKLRYAQLAFPLHSMKDQVKMKDLCWISCFCCFSYEKHIFRCFSQNVQVLFTKSVHFSLSWLWALGLSPSIGLSITKDQQGQKSNEQSFIKSEFSLFTWTTTQMGCLLKNIFKKDPWLNPVLIRKKLIFSSVIDKILYQGDLLILQTGIFIHLSCPSLIWCTGRLFES